jgi:hypothetical protein
LRGYGHQLIEDGEFDPQLECVGEILDRLFRVMLVSVGQDDVDEIGRDDEAVDGDEIPFDAAHVDFVVGREDLDGAPDVKDRKRCFLEKDDQLGDTEHDVVSWCPEFGDTGFCVVCEP